MVNKEVCIICDIKIYQRLMDQESKDIYKSRLLYSLIGNYDEIRRIVAGTKEVREIKRRICAVSDGSLNLSYKHVL